MSNRPYKVIVNGNGKKVVRVTDPDYAIFSQYGIPKGYECDGASIPSYLCWLCGKPTEYPRVIAAIIHDYLYEMHGYFHEGMKHTVSRKRADLTYRSILISLEFPEWRADIEYGFIRVFGGSHW